MNLYTRTFPVIAFVIALFSANDINGQSFTKITDTSNPIVSDGTTGAYIGASWIDFDNDGFLDLYVCRQALYRNLGNGNFERVLFPNQGAVQGNSWADYDNDGDIDCFLVSTSSNVSFLYRNDGGNVFTRVRSEGIGDSSYNSGWGCTWGDYNNDGYVDLVIASANNFGIVNHPSRFFRNNGDGTFERIDTAFFTIQTAPYTIPSWSDYDLDGDIDLFIGSGPAGTLARDYLFRNHLKETGTPYLERIDTSIIGTDLVDGQVWNWIDYDNDGDMDAYLTNYRSATPNNLYRNEGNQYLIKTTAQQVGSIVSDIGQGLTNVWGDFDNDGDLDCIVTNDDVSNRYYSNNNNGTFTKITTLPFVTASGPHYGVTAGDYDRDGLLDLYIAGTVQTKGLYRNVTENGNSWVNIKCTGVGGQSGSNYSAIGTKVRAKALINGVPVWQIREISAQNSFNSMNMLNVHFGFGDAVTIDSIIIEWTRGIKDIYTNVQVNKFYEAIEGQSITVGVNDKEEAVVKSFILNQNYPNPFNPATTISFSTPDRGFVSLVIYDVLGAEVQRLVDREMEQGNYSFQFAGNTLASGVYYYQLRAGNFIETKKMILIR